MKKILFIIGMIISSTCAAQENLPPPPRPETGYGAFTMEERELITAPETSDNFSYVLYCVHQKVTAGKDFDQCMLTDPKMDFEYNIENKNLLTKLKKTSSERMLDECSVQFPSKFCGCFVDRFYSKYPKETASIYKDMIKRNGNISDSLVSCMLDIMRNKIK